MKIIIVFLLFSIHLISKDNYSIILNPSLNYNIHSPNFTNFEGISNYTSSKYNNTSSVTPSISFLLNYKYDNKIFNLIG